MISTRRGSLPTSAAERDGAGGGRDGGEIDYAVFGFGDDLLRHDQHVAVGQRAAGAGEGGDDQVGQVVAGRTMGRPGRAKSCSWSGVDIEGGLDPARSW